MVTVPFGYCHAAAVVAGLSGTRDHSFVRRRRAGVWDGIIAGATAGCEGEAEMRSSLDW
jgi:hypothetical protein